MAQKITHWLVIALILSLGAGQLLRMEIFGVPVLAHDILVVILLGRLTLQGLVPKADRRLLLFASGLAIGWVRALTLYPISVLAVPALYTVRLGAYLALYQLLRQTKIKIDQRIFIIAGIVTVMIGILQYVCMPDMRWAKYLGWDDHLNRLVLPHFDPTFTGVMVSLLFLMLPTSRWYIGAIAAVGILLTYSRSVWLSLITTAMLFVRNKIILIGIVLAILGAALLLPQRFGEGTNLLRTFSIESRWSHDMRVMKDLNWNMIIGVGMNTLTIDRYSEYALPNHATSPNNSYLYVLATTGVVGLVGWVLFMRDVYQRSRYRPMLVFVMIASLFNNVMFYPFVLVWILLVETVMVPSES